MFRDGTSLRGRIARNVGWLAGGKLYGGVLSLVYLAAATRTLGLAEFGRFVLIVAFAQLVAGLVQFQSWQIVIQYGERALADRQPARLRRLIRLCATLDALGAVLAAGCGVVVAPLVGPALGWSAATIADAQMFSIGLIGWVRATPTGVLRLADRFHWLTWGEALTPTARLVGTLAVIVAGGGVRALLTAWAVAELVTSLGLWALAILAVRRHGGGPLASARAGSDPIAPGLWRFALATNLTGSLNAAWQQWGVLAVGALFGPAAAGAYRVLFQLALGLSKPALLLARVVYPEFARLAAPRAIAGFVWRAALGAGFAGLILVALALVGGDALIRILAGAPLPHGVLVLAILAAAVATELAGFALEPALLALQRPALPLLARLVCVVSYAALLAVLLPRLQIVGAALAWLGASLAATLLAAVLLWRSVSPAPPRAAPPDPAR